MRKTRKQLAESFAATAKKKFVKLAMVAAIGLVTCSAVTPASAATFQQQTIEQSVDAVAKKGASAAKSITSVNNAAKFATAMTTLCAKKNSGDYTATFKQTYKDKKTAKKAFDKLKKMRATYIDIATGAIHKDIQAEYPAIDAADIKDPLADDQYGLTQEECQRACERYRELTGIDYSVDISVFKDGFSGASNLTEGEVKDNLSFDMTMKRASTYGKKWTVSFSLSEDQLQVSKKYSLKGHRYEHGMNAIGLTKVYRLVDMLEDFTKNYAEEHDMKREDLTEYQEMACLCLFMTEHTTYENYSEGFGPLEMYYSVIAGKRAHGICSDFANTTMILGCLAGHKVHFIESREANHAWNSVEIDGEEWTFDSFHRGGGPSRDFDGFWENNYRTHIRIGTDDKIGDPVLHTYTSDKKARPDLTRDQAGDMMEFARDIAKGLYE